MLVSDCTVENMAISLHTLSVSLWSCYRFTLEMASLIALSLGVSYTPSNSLTECLVRCFNCCVLVHCNGVNREMESLGRSRRVRRSTAGHMATEALEA